MAMPNIPNEPFNDNIDEVCRFVDTMAERGELPPTSAVQKVSAIRSITSVLSEDEPREAKWILDNLDDITRRWATKHPEFKSTTVKTYESKARSGIEAYFEWKRDPKGFKFERHGAPRVERGKEEKASKAAPPPQVAPSNDTGRSFRYPLPGGRDFQYSPPSDGLSVAEVRRIGMHLLTLATDWEPGTPATPAESFAVVRQSQD